MMCSRSAVLGLVAEPLPAALVIHLYDEAIFLDLATLAVQKLAGNVLAEQHDSVARARHAPRAG